jgi:hypothetical protein
VIYVFYGLLAGGAVLLALDLVGRLTVRSRVGLWRAIGLIAAAGPGLAPILAVVTNRLTYSGLIFPAVAVAYLLAFLVFVAGVSGRAGGTSLVLRRVGYAGLLLLGALPSFVLLALTPLIFIAGAGLVRGRGAVARPQ